VPAHPHYWLMSQGHYVNQKYRIEGSTYTFTCLMCLCLSDVLTGYNPDVYGSLLKPGLLWWYLADELFPLPVLCRLPTFKNLKKTTYVCGRCLLVHGFLPYLKE